MKTKFKTLLYFIPTCLGLVLIVVQILGYSGPTFNSNYSLIRSAVAQNPPNSTIIQCNFEENQVGCIDNPVKNAGTVSELLVKLTFVVLSSIAIITVVVIMYGGVLLILGSGNPTQRKKAKEMIIWALIGLIVTLMSYSIVAIVGNIIQTPGQALGGYPY